MAPSKQKKKMSSSKSASPKKKTPASNTTSRTASFREEIIILLMFAFSMLLFIAIYFGSSAGNVGSFFNQISFQTMGAVSYIFPFYLCIITLYKLANKNNKRVLLKIVCSVLLLVVLAAFFQVLANPDLTNLGLKEAVDMAQKMSKPATVSGGAVGGFVTHILHNLFGNAGAVVVLSTMLIILFIFLAERSFVEIIKKLTRNTTNAVTKSYEEAGKLMDQTYEKLEEKKARKNKAYASEDNSVLLERVTISKEDIAPIATVGPTIIGGPTIGGLVSKAKGETLEVDEAVEPFIQLSMKTKTKTKDKPMDSKVENEPIENLEIKTAQLQEAPDYVFPSMEFLTKGVAVNTQSKQFYRESALKLQKTLENFGVKVTVTHVSCGPAVTRYELQPEQGTKVSKIVALADDIKLNLEAADIRIEAPIPGKAAVGIEVPNKETQAVLLRDIIESDEFKKFPADLTFAVGKDVSGQLIIADIAKMPHLLIAGATGSGKSVCINTLITSIIYKSKPSDVKMIMIDPKVVELSVYNGIPHLLIPVVTDPKKASAALNWAVMEMTDRYRKFAEFNVRDLKGYNAKALEQGETEKLPQIVVIVDELADLMMVAPGEVEDSICRLAQMARAAGIHLVIATQRPSVNVITGLIKANIPSRISFAVSSGIDSRTIIDMNGAEKLLGKGDMLFYPVGMQKPIRVQGAFISDKEVSNVVEFLGRNQINQYNETVLNKIAAVKTDAKSDSNSEQDEYFEDAARLVIEKDKASIGMIQRMFRVGFNRASRVMDQLEEAGVVGSEDGTKPRNIIMTMDQFEDYINL